MADDEKIFSERIAALKEFLIERSQGLEKLFRAELIARDRAMDAALAAAKEAVTKSEESQRRINEGQNEFRGAMKDAQSQYMPRAESEALHREKQLEIENLRLLVNTMQSKGQGLSMGWGYLVGAVGIAAAIASALSHR